MTLTVEKDDHVRGSGPVTVLVYGDYECPYTRALELVVMQLRRRDSDSFRYVYRYFPLREIHPHAEIAAEAAEAVSALAGPEAFWRMHDSLFADQYHLESDDLEQRATATGVNMRGYLKAMGSHQYAERVERDVQSGSANGVEGTPSVFINGVRYHGRRDESTLREAIKSVSSGG
jgi:NhaA family Na+:H+ antiporter